MGMKKTKLFFFSPSLAAGGLERVLSVLSKPMADHYDEVTYITWHDKPVFYEIDNRVKIICVEKECGSNSILKKILWFNKYVLNGKPDLLISFSTPFNMIALTALAGSGIKVVVAERNDPAHFRWGWFAKQFRDLLYCTADGILVQTETCKNHLRGLLSKRAIVIPNPLLMDQNLIGSALRTEKTHLIVSASRLVPQKRNDLIIKVFARFLESHSDYSLTIYGDGPEREKLVEQVSQLGIEEKVLLPGNVKNIWEKIKGAEMFVMASEYEGMSNALLEAMCLGLPCISTKVSGAVDFINDGENGLLVDINDEEALFKAIQKLADNKELRNEIGKKARFVAEELDSSKIAVRWIEYINNIFGN